MTSVEKLKQKTWHFFYKFFPRAQKTLLHCHLIWHEKGRQRYHIGWLAPGKTLEDLKNHLHSVWGFGNHFIAWGDDGQVLSWRKLMDFNHQYHLRVFEDGEIRGHFELTPEGHPLGHLEEKDETFHKREFKKFLGDFVTSEKHISHLERDPQAFNPEAEMPPEFIK